MRTIDFYELSDYTVPARGKIDMIILHWSAGHYGQFFSDYHLNIDSDGSLHTNMTGFDEHKSHCWRRNSRTIGIALAAGYGAWIQNDSYYGYGTEPPTEEQIDMMAKVVAKICIEIGLPINSDYVLTHGEIANIDGYGIYGTDPDMRWDLWGLGDEIRERAKQYAYDWGY